jgi:peptidylprolyl isomerase
MRNRLALALLAGIAVSAQAPAPTPAPAPDDTTVVAQSGTTTLTAGELRAMVASTPADVRARLQHDPAAVEQLARTLLVQRLLLKQAEAEKWDQTPDVARRLAAARMQTIVSSYVAAKAAPPAGYPTDADVAAAYEANKGKLMLPRQYHLAQIVIALPQDASAKASADAEKRLRDLRAQLSKPRADFAAEARRVSDDKASAPKGGDLGWLQETALIPAIRTAVSGLQDGAVSDPVQTPGGWHLVKLLGTKPAQEATLAEAHDALVQALLQQRRQTEEQALIAATTKDAPIRIDEIALGHAVPTTPEPAAPAK